MAITPTNMPDLRSALLRTWQPGGLGQRWFDQLLAMPKEEMPPVGEVPTPETQLLAAEASDLWLVRRDAVDMIAQTAPSLPDESSLADDLCRMVPSGAALIAFEGGIECNTWDENSHLPPRPLEVMLIGFGSYPQDGREVEHVTITWYAPMSATLGAQSPHANEWMMVVSNTWDLGTAIHGQSALHRAMYGEREVDGSDAEDRRILLATLALASQERVIESRVTQDRAARRRAERAGRDPRLDSVRVCDLRSSSKESRTAATQQAGRYKHRWVVDGHWRSQPYGPGRELRRPVWISPYLKGPDGAPLLTGAKVKVLR